MGYSPFEDTFRLLLPFLVYFSAILVISLIFYLAPKNKSDIPSFFVGHNWTVLDAGIVLIFAAAFPSVLSRFISLHFFVQVLHIPREIFLNSLLLTFILLFLRFGFRQSLSDLGILKPISSEGIIWSLKWILTGETVFLSLLHIFPFNRIFSREIGGGFPWSYSTNHLLDYVSLFGIILGSSVFLLSLSVAGILEEVIFRGIFYDALRRKTHVGLAIIISSVIFTISHGRISLSHFVTGCFFAYLYETYQSLLPSIAAHIMWNLAISIFYMIRMNYTPFGISYWSAFIFILVMLSLSAWLASIYLERRKRETLAD